MELTNCQEVRTIRHQARSPGAVTLPDRSINVDYFLDTFDVKNPEVQSALRKYPVLCYQLGIVDPVVGGKDSRPDNTERDYHLLLKGAGHFNLMIEADCMRWRGIANHVFGSTRQVVWLAGQLKALPPEKMAEFERRRYDAALFNALEVEQLRDYMLVSHIGRRQMDERAWHGVDDEAHPSERSDINTAALLEGYHAHPLLLVLLGAENARGLIQRREKHDLCESLLSWCDWTYNQSPVTLEERYKGLRTAKREAPEVLDALEQRGLHFQRALYETLGGDVFRAMTTAPIPAWEVELREAYCAASALPIEDVFSKFTGEREARGQQAALG